MAFLADFFVFGAGGAARDSFFGGAGLAIFCGVVFWIAKVLEAFLAVDFPAEIRSFFAGAILDTLPSRLFREGSLNAGSHLLILVPGWRFAVWSAGAAAGSSEVERFLKALITSKEPRAAKPYWINPCQSGLVVDR